MPPERLTNIQKLRPVSDLWSLAATFCYAMTGQGPYDFRERNPAEVILQSPPTPLRQLDASIPAAVADVLDRALRVDPAQRYPTAADMKRALEEAFFV